jgi:hypothetical protein
VNCRHRGNGTAIETAIKCVQSEQAPDSEMEADIQAITEQAQAILKREWQRVKRGI